MTRDPATTSTRPPGNDLLKLADIVRYARHEISGETFLKETQRQILEMAIETVAQVVDDPLAGERH